MKVSPKHRAHYSKLVTKEIKLLVIRNLEVACLLGCKCEHFNDIPLKHWDNLAGYLSLRQSLAVRVCILKEAARQIVEEQDGVQETLV